MNRHTGSTGPYSGPVPTEPASSVHTPVAFIIFNRPETTERVFREIAKAKPSKLLVVCDGPRENRKGEAEKVAATRAVVQRVNWDCDVLTHYATANMGCKRRVSSGIDWIFEQVEEAIILEDDCIPHPDFFRYCDELLARYRMNDNIAQIGGVNFQFGRNRIQESYYFSRYPHIWGWATWRRSWKHYDLAMRAWPELRDGNWLRGLFESRREQRYWEKVFDAVFDNQIDTWDYQWTFSCLLRGALTVLPNRNLISNIGFGDGATHTRRRSLYADMAVEGLEWPLRHPASVTRHVAADAYTSRTMFNFSLPARVRKVLAGYLGRPV